MADINKDSFDEDNLHMKVILQRGRVAIDFEFNEMQDILRVMLMRAMINGTQSVSNADDLNPGTNDDGFLIVGSGASSVTVKAGYLFCDGLPIPKSADSTLSGFTVPGVDRTDTVYLAITETEVVDPAQVPQLGETSRRRKLSYTIGISVTGEAGVPANTPQEIWEGGIRYFKLANIARYAGVASINAGDVTDLRKLLPPSVIAEITRQLNGHVAALVASTIETPDGTLRPESPAMFFDADPADSFAGTRAFAWTWARDAATRTPMSLVESPLVTGKTAMLLVDALTSICGADVLALSDVNQVTSTGTKFVPLTDEEDTFLKVGGSGAGAPGEVMGGVTPEGSIVRSLNARSGVSVGDGSTSFGDFNGSTALRDAFAWCLAQTSNQIVIYVKPGTYVIDADEIMSDGPSVTLIGTGMPGECVLQIVDPTAFYMDGVSVRVENITFTVSGLTVTALTVENYARTGIGDDPGLQTTIFRNCVFNGRVTLVSPVLDTLFEDCVFDVRTETVLAVPCIRASVADQGIGPGTLVRYFGKTFFKRCLFKNYQRAVFEIFRATGLTGHQVLGEFVFDSCRFELIGTTAGASLATQNVGVIDFTTADALPLDDDFTSVEAVRWIDCTVRANCLGDIGMGGAYSAVSTLMKLTGYPHGVTTGDASPYTRLTDVWEVEVRGGRWTCPATPTTYNPFSITPPTATNVIVQDVFIGFDDQTVQGGPEDDVEVMFQGGSFTNLNWAAFVFATGSVNFNAPDRPQVPALRMRGVRVTGGDASTSGDVLIGMNGQVDIDGFNVDGPGEAAGGGGSDPQHRVKFMPGNTSPGGFTGYHRVRGMTVRLPGSINGTQGVFRLEPGLKRVHFEDCYIEGAVGGATSRGISFNITADNDTFEDIHFTRCRVRGMGIGVQALTALAFTGVVLNDIVFDSCVILENQGIGIDFTLNIAGAVIRDLSIKNCRIQQNTGLGFRIRSPNLDNYENVIIEGNRCSFNNGSTTATQAHIEDTGAGSGTPRFIIMNNKFSEGVLNRGNLKITRGGAAALITPRGFNNPLAPSVYGAQTAHSITNAYS